MENISRQTVTGTSDRFSGYLGFGFLFTIVGIVQIATIVGVLISVARHTVAA